MDKKDYQEYLRTNIIPTLQELKSQNPPDLSKLLIDENYESVRHYLHTHFYLLREDFIRPLRHSLQKYLQAALWKKRQNVTDCCNFYTGIKLQYLPTMSTDYKKFYTISFDDSLKLNGKSRCLKPGSLICLSANHFKTMFYVTVCNDDTIRRENEVLVQVSEGSQHQHMNSGRTLAALKSCAYFESYNPVLRCLQMINPDTLPMTDHFIFSSKSVSPPIFFAKNVIFNLACLNDGSVEGKGFSNSPTHSAHNSSLRSTPTSENNGSTNTPESVPLLEPSRWPSPVLLGLDESQYRALQLSFSRSIAIIQGPPGTGKSFIGFKIVQAFLANREHWCRGVESRPILVVSFTNFALDQFLEKIYTITKNIVRVGSRSQSKLLERRNYKYLEDKLGERDRLSDAITYTEVRIEKLEELLETLKTDILNEDKIIINLKDKKLKDRLNENRQMLQSNAPLYAWLGLTFDTEISSDDGFINLLAESEKKDKDISITTDAEEKTDKQMEETKEKKLQFKGKLKELSSLKSLDIGRLDDLSYHFISTSGLEKELKTKFQELALKKKKTAMTELLKKDKMDDKKVKDANNIWELSFEDRWRMYRRWAASISINKEREIEHLKEQLKVKEKRLIDLNNELDFYRGVKHTDVIGMTTTGAAKNWQLLQELGCQIVIVEEAAKTLESHVICSLNPQTKHLILIGDHQQLKPQVAVPRLAKDYNLDVSLFERLIMNKFPFALLSCQHRMRPEISRIVRQHFYPHLEDHSSVKDFPPVRGISKSVFFVDLSSFEKCIQSPSITYSNQREAKFIVALLLYLLNQRYSEKQISVLTTYNGQLMEIENMISSLDVNQKDLQIATVDSYQGKENDIVLLSLVRGNESGQVGFLKEKGRMNVAFSRAHIGLYVIGNISFLAKNCEFWNSIYSDLKEQNLVGPSIEIFCENHPSIVNKVAWAEDFQRVSPNGGCTKSCRQILSCGHICKLKCHMSLNHKCARRTKTGLPCGHTVHLLCNTDMAAVVCFKCNKENSPT